MNAAAPALDDRQSAVALSYDDKTRAPIVVAKGYGVVAESILREARENGLYVHASGDLVKLLMQVDLDQQIQQLSARHPGDPALAALSGTYHNLLRMWSQA